MIAPRGRLASAAFSCVIAIASSACNEVFGLVPIEETTGDASISGGGKCTRASGSLKISNDEIFPETFPTFTMNLSDSQVTVASGYDAVLEQSSFTIKTLKVPDMLCSAALTVVLAGEPMAGKVYEIIPNMTDPRFAMERDAWVKLDIDNDTSAMCSGPARWEPEPARDQSLTVEAFDGSALTVRLPQVQLEGVVRASSPVIVDGSPLSICFGAH